MTTNPANAKGSWFGRDPATLVAQVVSAVVALLVLLPLVMVLKAALSALVIAAGGVVIAFAVRRDGQLAAIIGVGKAGIALIVVLGVQWDPVYQALLLVAIEQVAMIFVRDRVEAKVPASATVRGPVLREAA
jgi:hypothetical protein